ncbi:MAG: SDR family oxidoreductase [Calditrichaeota bacterium]|nr:MAG: SDR family NAD(P)-dependent oxidoreductase [Calditrichota bacterium]MBL1204737.1 SDR family oxidoreductase [Calditrichota bacterium]
MNNSLFDIKNKVVAITGGGGVLGSVIACALAEQNCKVAIMDLKTDLHEPVLNRLEKSKADYAVFKCDVLNKDSIEECKDDILKKFGQIDVLINGAGGNHPKSTTNADMSFFNIPAEAFNWVMQLNLTGTVLPSQVFGKLFADQGSGNILNISSMNAFRPLTRIPAYSSAKAAVSNFTQWLAVHMAQEYSANIRVNAIAPGFFLTNQNRFLLTDEKTGKPTERGKSIIGHTPMGRYGNPEDLVGTIVWLLSDASAFVTGIVVPVDGGFSAFSGV